MLTYHQAAVTLSGLTHGTIPDALARLERREHELGLRLPAAVREWFALNLPDDLWGLGDQDKPYGIVNLGPVESGYGHDLEHHPLAQDYLVIMDEHQHVARWAVHLDGSDDPPVIIQTYNDRLGSQWHRHADRFSTFAYARVWDYQVMFKDGGCRVEGGGLSPHRPPISIGCANTTMKVRLRTCGPTTLCTASLTRLQVRVSGWAMRRPGTS